jgi:alkyldihydroxyacetonephosphate synthase
MAIWEIAMTTCLETGAAISHHHGVGLARTPYLRAALGSSGVLLDRLKDALDPAHIMNPGKFDFPAPAGARADDNGRK